MFRTLIARFRAKHVSSSSPEKPTYLQKASVEQIWESMAIREIGVDIDAAEQVKQLKRIGEYEKALRVALAELKLAEKATPSTRSPGITGKRLGQQLKQHGA